MENAERDVIVSGCAANTATENKNLGVIPSVERGIWAGASCTNNDSKS